MHVTNPVRSYFLLVLLFAMAASALGQARINTEKAGKKMLDKAEQKRKEAHELRMKRLKLKEEQEHIQKRLQAIREEKDQVHRELAEAQSEQQKIREAQIANLNQMVWKTLQHPEAGPWVMEDRQRIRQIPAFKTVLESSPFLDPILDEILASYLDDP